MNSSPDHSQFMREAIALAKEGMEGNHGGPFGAVIVKDGQIIGRGYNRVTELNDPTAHAEVTAIRDAGANQKNPWLEGSTLYTSCQPCVLCLGAAFWAHVQEIIYAATEEDAARIGFDDAEFYRRMNFRFQEVRIPMQQLMQPDAAEVMDAWLIKQDRKHY